MTVYRTYAAGYTGIEIQRSLYVKYEILQLLMPEYMALWKFQYGNFSILKNLCSKSNQEFKKVEILGDPMIT